MVYFTLYQCLFACLWGRGGWWKEGRQSGRPTNRRANRYLLQVNEGAIANETMEEKKERKNVQVV